MNKIVSALLLALLTSFALAGCAIESTTTPASDWRKTPGRAEGLAEGEVGEIASVVNC